MTRLGCGIVPELEANVTINDDIVFSLYVDPAYPLLPYTITPFCGVSLQPAVLSVHNSFVDLHKLRKRGRGLCPTLSKVWGPQGVWLYPLTIPLLLDKQIFQFCYLLTFVFKFIQIVILWVYYTIPFGFTLFWHFWAYISNFLNYFLWLRITVWSISLIKSDLKWCIQHVHLSRSLFFNL